jgi:ethanolamine utilization cobalamin adenosyltransferase
MEQVMAFITESELREKWKGGTTRFDFPAGTRFSPAALDFIKQWQLDVTVAGEKIVPPGPRVHHYQEDLPPQSLGRATDQGNPARGAKE